MSRLDDTLRRLLVRIDADGIAGMGIGGHAVTITALVLAICLGVRALGELNG